MVIATDYPFLDIFWTMLVFVAWVIWFMLLFRVFGDVFRRHDIGGGHKVIWLVFVICLPFLGVFVYLIAQSRGMNERNIQQAEMAQRQFDDHVKSVVSSNGAAGEIEKAKQLLDGDVITQAEFDALKQEALA